MTVPTPSSASIGNNLWSVQRHACNKMQVVVGKEVWRVMHTQ